MRVRCPVDPRHGLVDDLFVKSEIYRTCSVSTVDDDDKEGSDDDDDEAGTSKTGNKSREATSEKGDNSKRVYRLRHRNIRKARSYFCTNEQIRDIKEPFTLQKLNIKDRKGGHE